MNGKDMKFILPLAVVVVIILSIVGVAMMSGPDDGDGNGGTDKRGPYTMSMGPILDEDGEPIEGALVVLQSDSGPVGSVVTDSEGLAELSFDEKIEEGDYELLITKDDYEVVSQNVTVTYDGTTIEIEGITGGEEIDLIPEPEPPVEFSVGPVKGIYGTMSDIEVVMKSNDDTIKTSVTDLYGIAKFSFDTPPEDGEYLLLITVENYEKMSIEITLNYDSETDILNVSGNITDVDLVPIQVPEPIPPIILYVGPISDVDGALEGVTVDIKLDDTLVLTVFTDESGYAKFVFDTPPKDDTYTITITLENYYEKNIDVKLNYNEETYLLTASGEITDITLEKIIPPEPENDPDYYKEFDAYKLLEDAKNQPVDVEGELDQNKDGTPEFQVEIEDELKQDVNVEEYVALDVNGDPDYSSEINNYEPINQKDYLARQARSDNPSGSKARNGAMNLTHFDDMIDQNKILYDGTQDIMEYDTEAINMDSAQEFSEEIVQAPLILNNSFTAGYINGTNSTDANNDGNPERVVVWNVSYNATDRNNDNKTDHLLVGLIIYELIDNNSNGFFEHTTGFFGALNASDDDYNGTYEDVLIVVVFGEERKLDGNFTENYTKMSLFYNHTIDKNNDSNYEFQRAAIYTKQAFDNNSNGNHELKIEFAGGFEGIDNNSNGKYEKALLIWGGSVKIDTKDNGNDNINMSSLWIYYVEDQNEDKKLENATGLTHTKWYFDNNSNGNVELRIEVIAGIHVVDSDSDGKLEKVDVVKAVGIFYDKNDDGIEDSNLTCGFIFLVTDKNEDTKPEFQQALFYCAWNFDNNSNGNHEWSRQAISGFLLKDNNSDGIYNELFAVHYCVDVFDSNDNGTANFNRSFAYAIHVVDADDDGNIEYKHAVFGYAHQWDNNSDGNYEAINQMAAGYIYEDDNDDGNVNNESFFILVNKTYDWNNDGYPEVLAMTLMASTARYADNGTILYARNVLLMTLAWDNNSNGHYHHMSQVLLGNEGFNGTRNGSKIDWEKENVLLIWHVRTDTDDDGTWDTNPIFIKVEKTI